MLGINMSHMETYVRNGVRYTVYSDRKLPIEDALQIVRSLYEYEFATGRL